jgi:hypothetical protein
LGAFVTGLAGFGLGAIPTLNNLVAQFTVPKRLLGVAVGAMFFFVMLGMAIAPAILGSAMNASYARNLESTLPAELNQVVDESFINLLRDPRVLLSPTAMEALEVEFNSAGQGGSILFAQTVYAVQDSLAAGLKTVYLIGAITMLGSFLLIITIPEIPIEMEVMDRKRETI